MNQAGKHVLGTIQPTGSISSNTSTISTTTSTTTTTSQTSQTPRGLLSEGLIPVQGADKIKIVGYQVYYTAEEEEHNCFLKLHVKFCAIGKEAGAITLYTPSGKKVLDTFFDIGNGVTCHTYGIGGYNATLAPGTWKIVFTNPLNDKTIAIWYWDVRSRDVKVNWIKVGVTHTDDEVAFTKFQVSLTNNGNVPVIFQILYYSGKPHTFPIPGPWSVIPPHTTKVYTVTYKHPMGMWYEKVINGYFELRLSGGSIKIPYALTPPPKGQTTTITIRP
ncbi:hypothetical protein, partial [Archaeoglobus sp.]